MFYLSHAHTGRAVKCLCDMARVKVPWQGWGDCPVVRYHLGTEFRALIAWGKTFPQSLCACFVVVQATAWPESHKKLPGWWGSLIILLALLVQLLVYKDELSEGIHTPTYDSQRQISPTRFLCIQHLDQACVSHTFYSLGLWAVGGDVDGYQGVHLGRGE